MSQSFLSMTCAGLLLAAGALAATESAESTLADAPVPTAAAAASRAAKSATVTLFVTVRDAKGKVVAKPSASVEAANSDQPQAVGPNGAKVSLPAGASSDVVVLIPSTNCKVTLSPKMAGRNVMIVVDRLDSGTQCTASEMNAPSGAASAPGGGGKDRHGRVQPAAPF